MDNLQLLGMDDLQLLGIVVLVCWFVPSPISVLTSWWKDRELEREKARFKESYTSRLELEAKGLELLKSENETLKKETENLRITLKTLQNKPGRAELRQLYVYDAAINYVLQRLPQIVTTWQEALKYGEEEMLKKESGSNSWLTKIFRVPTSYELSELPSNQKQITGS